MRTSLLPPLFPSCFGAWDSSKRAAVVIVNRRVSMDCAPWNKTGRDVTPALEGSSKVRVKQIILDARRLGDGRWTDEMVPGHRAVAPGCTPSGVGPVVVRHVCLAWLVGS